MNLADLTHLNAGNGHAAACTARSVHRRESLLVCYQSDPGVIAELLPAPLQPDGSDAVSLQFSATPAPGGRGVDIVAQIAIDAELRGMPVQFIVRGWTDEPAADAAQCEIADSPGRARLFVVHGQMTAVLESAGRAIAIASLDKRPHLLGSAMRQCPAATIAAWLARPQVYRQSAFHLDGHVNFGRLVSRRCTDIAVSQAYCGPAELELAPLGASPLPVIKVLGGAHFVADLTLLPARVVESRQPAPGIASRHLSQELCA